MMQWLVAFHVRCSWLVLVGSFLGCDRCSRWGAEFILFHNVLCSCQLCFLWSCFSSSKQNLGMFSLFLLYSRTVLHATKCISCGLGSCDCDGGVGFWYVSVAIAKSLFRIRLFALLCVSIDIVVGV